ncbi:hypothetical protein MED121_12295 [Marinomonas sp. MED121]|uniref:hypothetical protein n=1 Tax=Marinomonas sp. MED121 TaxID=314277 RepID=UPI000068FF35|nr:hypothetical protein [Marinomonas sp. MED121]EAQ66705.1 hypothetical protein MED121_12295 [Marinomonas sp. MED121]
MPKYWTEKLNIEKWRIQHGGKIRELDGKLIDNLVCPIIYCVEVCKFTFRFSSKEEIIEYIDYFSSKNHSSTRIFFNRNDDHYDAQTKFTRLPAGLNSNHNRPKVLKALEKAIVEFRKI